MSTPLEIFCCYAREDQEMLEHLKKHLTPLLRQGQITIWSDTNLNAGVEWEKELHRHLESADLILLLISPDFMNSDYCYSTEMGRAIQRHKEGSAHVIPLLLRSTFWDNAPFAKLQVVPTGAKHVTAWSDRDEVFHDITRHINRVVSELQMRRAQVGAEGQDEEQPATKRDFFLATSFDPAKLMVLRTLTGNKDDVHDLVISPDSTILASATFYSRIVKLWELPSGRELRTIDDGGTRVAISPDGKILAGASSGNFGGSIKLWELPSGQKLSHISSTASRIYHISISPDSKILAPGASNGIEIWELPSGRKLYTLTGHKKDISHLAISPDGKFLASGSEDRTIRLWELPSGQELRALIGHKKGISGIAISPNGKFLVEPHYAVKREGVVEKTSIHWHTVAYANTDRADGRVETILPE